MVITEMQVWNSDEDFGAVEMLFALKLEHHLWA